MIPSSISATDFFVRNVMILKRFFCKLLMITSPRPSHSGKLFISKLENEIQDLKNEYDKIISNITQQIEEFVQKANLEN